MAKLTLNCTLSLCTLTQLVPCLVLIATALGVNTDPLAELLGRWVSKR